MSEQEQTTEEQSPELERERRRLQRLRLVVADGRPRIASRATTTGQRPREQHLTDDWTTTRTGQAEGKSKRSSARTRLGASVYEPRPTTSTSSISTPAPRSC
jgi:hypothetical protein